MLYRWRLVLGKFAEDKIPIDEQYNEQDMLLSFLYDREYDEGRGLGGGNGSSEKSMQGSNGRSNFTIPEWFGKIKKAFPKRTVEIMQKHALNKYGLNEMLTNSDVLASIEPDVDLLKKLLAFKSLVPAHMENQVREIIGRVVDELMKKLESQLRVTFYGKKTNSTQTHYKVFKNFDFKKTITRNMKNYSHEYGAIVPERLYFHNTVKNYNPWNVIILVDESGSMTDSIVYCAVMAGIFSKMPFIKINLVIFDTSVVDLSEYKDDPVEVLLKVQLGGGTDIYKALSYGESLISSPQKTIMVLVSDLCEGGDIRKMYRKCKDIIESGTKLFVLPALDYNGEPSYNKNAAKIIAGMGADVAAITPEKLSEWISNIIS